MRKLIEGIKYKKVSCGNGHELAIIPMDRVSGICAEDLTHPKLQHFKNGDTIEGCPDCNSRAIKYKKILN